MSSHTAPRADAAIEADGRTAVVRAVEQPPPEAPVRHFDELPDEAQQFLAESVAGSATSVPVSGSVARALADEPVVVFTDYLRIELS